VAKKPMKLRYRNTALKTLEARLTISNVREMNIARKGMMVYLIL